MLAGVKCRPHDGESVVREGEGPTLTTEVGDGLRLELEITIEPDTIAELDAMSELDSITEMEADVELGDREELKTVELETGVELLDAASDEGTINDDAEDDDRENGRRRGLCVAVTKSWLATNTTIVLR